MAGKELTLGVLFKGNTASLESAIKRLQTSVGGLEKNLAGAGGSSKKFSADTQEAGKTVNFLGKQIGSVNGAIDRLKAAFKVTAAYGAASTAIYAVITAMKVGTQTIIDYDQALKNLQAITGATGAEVGAMGETIRDVARTTKFSTTEVAEGMVLLGQAGFSAGEAMDAIQATANLATGTLSDMKLTTDLLTTTIRAFNLDTIESGRVSDVMANAINKSKLTIDKLRISFSYIAATASQAGLSLEETAASMMVLANNGLRASTIGTGLRQVLARLLSPNAKLREAYEAHGIALDQINPKTVGYQEALKNLAKVLYNSETQTVNVSKAFELFGLRGAQAAAILVRDFAGGSFQTALKNVFAVGTAADMAGKQSEGLGVKLKNLVDRAKLVALGFGDAGISGAIGVFIDVLKKGTELLEGFASSTLGQIIIKVGFLTTAFVALRGAVVFLISAITGLNIVKVMSANFALLTTSMMTSTGATIAMTGALGKVKAAFLVLWAVVRSHPFALIASAVAAVLVVYNQLSGASERLADKLSEEVITVQKLAQGVTVYAETLAVATKGSDEYNAALERFKDSYPEVTQKILDMNKAIDLADISTEDLVSSMKEIATTQMWEAFKKSGEALSTYNKLLEDAHTIGVRFGLDNLFQELWHNVLKFGDAYDNLAEKTAKVKAAQDAYVNTIMRLVDVQAITIDQAYEYIDAMGLEEKKAQELKDAFQAHFSGIKLAGEEAAGGITKAFEGVPETFKQLYYELDALQQARLLKSVDSMQKEVAAYRKSVKDMGIAKWDSEKQIEAIQEEAYRKFVESTGKHVLANTQALSLMTEAWRAYYNTRGSEEQFEIQQQLKKLNKEAAQYQEFLDNQNMQNEVAAQKMTEWWNKRLAEYQEKEGKATSVVEKELQKRQEAYQKFADQIEQIESKMVEDETILRQSKMTGEQKLNDDLLLAEQELSSAQKAITAARTQDELEAAMKKLASAQSTYSELLRLAEVNSQQMQESARKKTTTEVQMASTGYAAWKNFYEKSGAALVIHTVETIKSDNKKVESAKDTAAKVKIAYDKMVEGVKASTAEALTKFTAMSDGVMGEIANIATEAGKPKPINITNDAARLRIQETGIKLIELKTEAESQKAIELDSTQAVGNIQRAIDTVKALIAAIAAIPRDVNVNVKITSTGTDTGGGQKSLTQGVSDATSQIQQFTSQVGASSGGDSGSSSGAVFNVGFTGSGSTTKPLGEKIKEAAGWIEGLARAASVGAKMMVSFTGHGSDEKPLSNKIDELDSEMSTFGDSASSTLTAVSNKTAVTGSNIASTAGGVASSMESAFTNALNTIIKKFDEFIAMLGKAQDSATMYVNEMTLLGPVLTAYDIDTGVAKWTRSFSAGGPTDGGQLSGYGGGDTVPIMAEKGEFIIRKEAVKKYGVGLFEKLNSMVAGMKIGGPVARITRPEIANKQAVRRFSNGGEVQSSASPSANINITLSPMFLTGDRNSMRQAASLLKAEISNINNRYGHGYGVA